ncbi:MAG: hypothetical protein IKQ31_03705 [Clostridia bacterium]|nr:hypothetical protein [Clostridia bacterium]
MDFAKNAFSKVMVTVAMCLLALVCAFSFGACSELEGSGGGGSSTSIAKSGSTVSIKSGNSKISKIEEEDPTWASNTLTYKITVTLDEYPDADGVTFELTPKLGSTSNLNGDKLVWTTGAKGKVVYTPKDGEAITVNYADGVIKASDDFYNTNPADRYYINVNDKSFEKVYERLQRNKSSSFKQYFGLRFTLGADLTINVKWVITFKKATAAPTD